MKLLTILFLFLGLFVGLEPEIMAMPLLEQHDKQLHIVTSGMLTFSTYMGLRQLGIKNKLTAYTISSLLVFNLGLAKECFVDQKFDNDDVLANSIGIGLVLPIIFF